MKRLFIAIAILLSLEFTAAQAQELSAEVKATRLPPDYPLHFWYGIYNYDDVPIAIVSFSGINAEWASCPQGWNLYFLGGGSVTCVADPGKEVYSGQSLGEFYLWGQSYNDTVIDYQLVGIWPGTEEGKATFGKTYGHSAY